MVEMINPIFYVYLLIPTFSIKITTFIKIKLDTFAQKANQYFRANYE